MPHHHKKSKAVRNVVTGSCHESVYPNQARFACFLTPTQDPSCFLSGFLALDPFALRLMCSQCASQTLVSMWRLGGCERYSLTHMIIRCPPCSYDHAERGGMPTYPNQTFSDARDDLPWQTHQLGTGIMKPSRKHEEHIERIVCYPKIFFMVLAAPQAEGNSHKASNIRQIASSSQSTSLEMSFHLLTMLPLSNLR